MQKYADVACLILGGGQGKRLFPLTRERSKPAVPFAGKYRLIDIPLTNCVHSGIRRIHVLTQFNSASLNNHIYQTYRFDHFADTYIDILAAEQTPTSNDWFQGTADAVRKTLMHLELHANDDILILSGDHFYRMDYGEIIDFHRKTKADITLSAIPVTARETEGFGILKVGGRFRVTGFTEKPSSPEALTGLAITPKSPLARQLGIKQRGKRYLASMGVYVFKAKTLTAALSGNDMDFGKEIIPHSIARFKTFAYPFNGYWEDIGTIKAFYTAHMDLVSKQPSFNIEDQKRKLFTHPRFLAPARIIRSGIDQSLIAEGSYIDGATITKSTIGLRTQVNKGTTINRSIIMGADFYANEVSGRQNPPIGIGPQCTIHRAIIDKNTRIGKKVTITNARKIRNYDGDNFYIREGIVIIPKNAVIQNNTTI